MRRLAIPLTVVLALAAGTPSAAAGEAERADRALDRALRGLVAAADGPPGAIAVVKRGRDRRVHRAGVAGRGAARALRAGKHMRIASVSKAFSGAAALTLVDEGLLGLGDTIGEILPDLPAAWHEVTLGQLLSHTGGVPDFTATQAFADAVNAAPAQPPAPRELLSYVEGQGLDFPPGSDYRYSNSDNVIVALMAAAVTGTSYERVLRAKVTAPLGLRRTRLGRGALLPKPFIHGYEPGTPPEDVSQLVAFGGWAWASGGIVATPLNLTRFVRFYAGGRLFRPAVRDRQFRFIAGAHSEPRGPGRNAAGLALFRYRTRCGTVFGHTGSILGYTQLIAATRNGRRSVTFTINRQVDDRLLPRLRRAQVRAVCAALARA